MRFPHCDERVLHAPGECQYCDHHPDWQQLRHVWNIAYSGHSPESGETACPVDLAVMWEERGDYNKWYGNRPEPYEGLVWGGWMTWKQTTHSIITVGVCCA
jgi:hypothetical protein